MGLATKLKGMIFGEEEGYYDDEDVYEDYDDDINDMPPQSSSVSKKYDSNVISMPTGVASHKERLVVSRPKTVDDVPEITDCLRMNMICVINLEGVDLANAQRIADFVSGAGCALSCDIERISSDIFIVAPRHVSVINDSQEKSKNGHILPWISALK